MSVRNIQKSLFELWGGGRCFRPFLNPVKSLNAALLQSKFDCIRLNNHSNWHISYKATTNYRCNFLIRDQSTCKGMKSGIKLPTLSGPKHCLPCWQEKNHLVVDLCCQKAREWNRDHSAVMKQRGPCAHTQCDNVYFEYVSRQVTSLLLEVSSVSSNSASIQKLKFAVGTVTQHPRRAGQRPVVQRGVPFYALKWNCLHWDTGQMTCAIERADCYSRTELYKLVTVGQRLGWKRYSFSQMKYAVFIYIYI